MDLKEIRRSYERSGYNALNATARTCQDVVLDRIARSSMSRNVAIKGGVLMCAISGSKRRATQDIDLDFLSYPISDEGVKRFIEALSNVDDDIDIRIKGPIEELSQHDYEEELERNSDEYLRVYSVEDGHLTELGFFEGSWEFEEWLCSDLSFEEWRKNR